MSSDLVYIDCEDGQKRVMNNAKLYVKLLAKFKETTSLKGVETALAAGNMQEAQAEIHTVKGVAANLSLMELFKQSLELENQIKAKSVNPLQLETIKKVFSQTLVEVDKVIAQNG